MACLKMLELMEVDQEVPMGNLLIGLVMMLGISSISSGLCCDGQFYWSNICRHCYYLHW